MLEFCNISKVFKSDLLKKPFVALEDLNFIIPEGKIIGFLGANGAGKTTSIKMIMDFIRPSSGEIKFGEELGSSRDKAFKHIGYLPERPFFYPHLTGREFCLYMGELADVSKKEIKAQIEKWAPIFKIEFALEREIKTYSKGMLQRVGFLATLLHSPKLIILDEPLSGLDPIGRKDLKDVIFELKKEGKTVFFSSHIVSDVEEVCDNVFFLKDGKMIFSGSVDEIINENIKPVSHIRMKRGNTIEVKSVEDDHKNKFLIDSIQDGYDILAIEQEKPTLEQIFYNVK